MIVSLCTIVLSVPRKISIVYASPVLFVAKSLVASAKKSTIYWIRLQNSNGAISVHHAGRPAGQSWRRIPAVARASARREYGPWLSVAALQIAVVARCAARGTHFASRQ